MKKILDFLKGTVITIWVFIAVITTIYLIFYNDYSDSEIGDLSIFIMDSNRLQPEFKKNDIVIVKKVSESEYNEGDFAFFYVDNVILVINQHNTFSFIKTECTCFVRTTNSYNLSFWPIIFVTIQLI